ncbi:MAG: hypothetical protein V8R91_10345 [Butyricimonas faecihominis]
MRGPRAPNKSIDIMQWLEFIFSQADARTRNVIQNYPLMKKKYEILQETMKKYDGFDITKLN